MPNFTFQYRKNGVDLPGEVSNSLAINPVAAADSGSYSVRITSTVTGLSRIVALPQSVVVTEAATPITGTFVASTLSPVVGGEVIFTFSATSVNFIYTANDYELTEGQDLVLTATNSLTYQLLRNGVAIAGAVAAVNTITDWQESDDGAYTLLVTDTATAETETFGPIAIAAPTPGDISNLIVNANGVSGSFEVRDLSSSLPTQFESGKTATIDVSADGYTGTVLTEDTGWTGQHAIEFLSSSFASRDSFVNDTFDEASTTALGSHSPNTDVVGTGWAALVNGGTVSVVGGGGYATWSAVTGGGLWDVWTIDSGESDTRLSTTWVSLGTNQRVGMAFRASDASNYWRFQTRVGDQTEGSALVKVVAGTPTTVATITGVDGDGDSNVFTAGVTETIQIVTNGSSIQVYFHGKLKISVTDAALSTNTRHGIATRNTGPRINDFASGSFDGQLTVNWITPEYIAAGSAVAITADVGLLTDGVEFSNVIANLAGTNNSTQAQQPAIVRHAFAVDGSNNIVAPFQITGGTGFTVDALAAHGYGIAAVRVQVTDGVTTLTNTQTALSLSNYTDDVYAAEVEGRGYDYVGSGCYKCGPFNLTTLDDGPLTITVTAYPERGNAIAVETDSLKVVNNSAGTYTAINQYVDSSGTLTLSSGLTADVADNQLITGGTSGAIAVTNGASLSGATSVPVFWMNGTFSAAETITVTNEKQATVATGTFSSESWVGSDAAAGTIGAPVRSVLQAVNNILSADDYGIVYVKGRNKTPSSTPQVVNVATIEVREWPSEVGSICMNTSTAASKIRHLRYFCDVNVADFWGTGQDSGAVFTGSGTTVESSITLSGLVTHHLGRTLTRHIASKPVNGIAFIDGVHFIGCTVDDIATDAWAAQGSRPYARNCLGVEVANNWAFDPNMLFCVAGRDVKIPPNKLYLQTGTLVGTPVVGDIIYQSHTSRWVVIIEFYQPGNLFMFDPSVGGLNGQATINTQFSDDHPAAFYDPTNFDQATGLPTGGSDGTFDPGVIHPDGVQYVGYLADNPGHNAIAVNVFMTDVQGQLMFATNIVDLAVVNVHGTQAYVDNFKSSRMGSSIDTNYINARNCLFWSMSLPNQPVSCRNDANTDRLGFQARNLVAANYTGQWTHGVYEVNCVARLSGSAASIPVTVVANPFENGVAGNAAYSASTDDYRPTVLMPTTSDVPWAYDMFGNLIPTNGTAFVGPMQEQALFDQVIGLRTGGITDCGRQSVNALKVPGVDAMPLGMSISGTTPHILSITSTFSGDLVDWDLRDYTLVINNGATVGELTNCVLGQTVQNPAMFRMLDCYVGGRINRMAYNDFIGNTSYDGAGSAINQRSTGDLDLAVGECPLIEFNRFVDLTADAIKSGGSSDAGGQIIQWNYFGWPKNLPQEEPLVWSAEVAYAAGAYVRDINRNSRRMISKVDDNLNNPVPTGTVSDDFWTVLDPHVDCITTFACKNQTTIHYNLFDIKAPPEVYWAGINNWVRVVRNTGTNRLFGELIVDYNVAYYPDGENSAPVEVSVGTGVNFNGPIRFRNNWWAPNASPSYFHGNTNGAVDEWVNNLDVSTLATITSPTLRVRTIPAFTLQPSSQSVVEFTNVEFSVTVTGNPIPTGQWFRDTGGGWAAIGGATATTLSFSAQLADSGNQYRYDASNTEGTTASSVATLTVPSEASLSIAVDDFNRDAAIFDSGAARGLSATDIPLSGTASASQVVQARAYSLDDAGATSTAWANIATSDGAGAWSGSMAAVPLNTSYYRAEVRLGAQTATTAQTSNKFAVGHIVAWWGQSEDHRIVKPFFDTAPDAVAVANDETLQIVYDERGDNELDPSNPVYSRVTAATPITKSVAAIANTLFSETAGEKFLLICMLKSGTSWNSLVDNSIAVRQWTTDVAIHNLAITEVGQRVGLAWSSWYAAPGSYGSDYMAWFTRVFFGKDGDGVDITVPSTQTIGSASINFDHVVSELYDYTYTKWMITDPHTFVPTSELLNAITLTNSTSATGQLNKQLSRQSVRSFMNAPGTFAGNVQPLGVPMLTYSNGESDGSGGWTDHSHPSSDTNDGLIRKSRLSANNILFGLGAVAWSLPAFDNCAWQADGSYVEVWSSAGAVTTTRIANAEAALPTTYPHWQPVIGFEVNGVPATNTSIVAGRVRIYKNVAEDAFTATDSITYGLGSASGQLRPIEDNINQLWKNLPIVNVGQVGVEGIPVLPIPDLSVLANTIVGNTTFQVSATGPYFLDTVALGASVSSLVFYLKFKPTLVDTTRQLAALSGAHISLRRLHNTALVQLNAVRDSSNTSITSVNWVGTLAPNDVWTEFLVDIDLINLEAVCYVDGGSGVSQPLAANTGVFDHTRFLSFLALNNATSQFVGEVELLKIWKNETVVGGAQPVATPYKIIEGNAATVNADPWKLGSDAT